MLRREQRVWTMRIGFFLATFVLGWVFLALGSSNWLQPDQVQKLIEGKLPVLKIFHPDVQAWLFLRAWQPILALLLAAVALTRTKSVAGFAVEHWWQPPPAFLGLPVPRREAQDFRSRATTLVGREVELTLLAAFVSAESQLSWCWLFGAPGSGKSRLALEWLFDLHKQHNWLGRQAFDLAFLPSPARDHEQWREWQPRCPTVLVVDNVADDTAAVDSLIAVLCSRGERLAQRVRLLLVERSRPELLRHFDERELFRQYRALQCPIILSPLSDGQVIRAVESLHRNKARSLATLDKEGLVRVSKGMPLFAIMAHESMAVGSGELTLDRQGILHDQVQRTRGKLESNGLPREHWPVLALATLCRGVTWTAASSFGLSQKEKGVVDAALGENTAEIIPPMKPDILGEAFLLDQFGDLIDAEREQLLKTAWSFAPERVHRTLLDLHLDLTLRHCCGGDGFGSTLC